MSEDFPITEADAPLPISHRRILLTMTAVAAVSSLAGFIFVSWKFGLGVAFGGILSLVNYYWLKVSIKKIFDRAILGEEKPGFLAVRYFVRYLTLGAILTIVFLTKLVPVVSVILGLASFALAIVVEGFIRVFVSFFKKKEI